MTNRTDREFPLENCIYDTRCPGLPEPYRGKVRDVYPLNDKTLGIVVTDRISAFDHIMGEAIPFKGQILNLLSKFQFEAVADIIPTHMIEVPHNNVTIARRCDPIPIEVVVRGYLTGHAWREYKSGKRMLCGASMPTGMKEHQAFPKPILTPATKAEEGHDEDISPAEILEKGIVEENLWQQIEQKAFELFERGSEIADRQGLILVDTKYEFGLWNGELTLIDEVHTSDSSRYFYKNGYKRRLENDEQQKQLSKEFLREWLMEKGFSGKEGQQVPTLPDSFRWSVYNRYKELFEVLTGNIFEPEEITEFNETLEKILKRYQ
ncbi:phosphoribosylaminoimidazolesuccinocarboxamide synthase [Rhodohalobacter sp. SW132]|uniref:phosphoribosylaminoimidazolesuccinocarboxamide synthase n=1 Tax=Rhodohalobacter sp. SW132 TaxID=2293433 RepID=UPI000E274EF3|nr:phosphoribosylaminoimidazolesuccinocarboxamide synthase [Rhodohalobacter sp. SW132]REL33608.1 phosphoribosylaminoimidazolesuccinocarboxamide synthase [Rhodohalobacter sp. SW132]